MVFKAKVYGVVVAVKALKLSNSEQDEQQQGNSKSYRDARALAKEQRKLDAEKKQFVVEMALLQTIRHPNMCILFGSQSQFACTNSHTKR